MVFKALGKEPAGNLTHVARWYRHIASYGKESCSFPGPAKSLEQLGLGGKTDKDPDDDFDLFGSDDDEEEAEKVKQERLKVRLFLTFTLKNFTLKNLWKTMNTHHFRIYKSYNQLVFRHMKRRKPKRHR